MPGPFSCDKEVTSLVQAFKDRSLPKSSWTHAVHFAVALWLLSHHGLSSATAQMPAMIRAYNESVGTLNSDASGYHETITQASLRVADHFLSTRTHQPLHAVCNALLSSPLGHPHWLLSYWSREKLFSPEARRAWTEPDLAPLPCGS